MKQLKLLSLLAMSAGLLLSGCAGGQGGGGQGGGGDKPQSKWYDEYVAGGYTLATSFPKALIAQTYSVNESIIPTVETTECVYKAVAADATEGTASYFEVVFDGDIYDDLYDIFDAANYDFYVDYYYGVLMMIDSTRTLEFDLSGYGEDYYTFDQTSLTVYGMDEIFSTTLSTDTDWNEDTKTVFASVLGTATLPFMAFGEEYEFYEYEGGLYMCDYYYQDLSSAYGEVLKAAGYAYLEYDEDTEEGDYYTKAIDETKTIVVSTYWDTYGNNIEVTIETTTAE